MTTRDAELVTVNREKDLPQSLLANAIMSGGRHNVTYGAGCDVDNVSLAAAASPSSCPPSESRRTDANGSRLTRYQSPSNRSS